MTLGRVVVVVVAGVTGFVMAVAAISFAAGMACRSAVLDRR